MIVSHLTSSWRQVLLAAAMIAAVITVAEPGAAQDDDFQLLHAPFECGTEWSGTTRSGHGVNDWNLDLNRTSLVWPDRSHDLGQPLLAQADGVITWIGTHVSAGTYMEIDYGDITAGYIHMVPGSIPDDLEIGSTLVSGQFFGELGDSGNANGFAHLHLEYYDSRTVENARRWQLPSDSQIQIRMAGEIISPGEVFVSTNCDGLPPAPPSPYGDAATSFAIDDIALMYELGIATGTTSTTYSPGDDVTREQMAAFLARLWRAVTPDADPPPDTTTTTTTTTSLPGDDGDEEEPEESDDTFPFDDVDPGSFAYDDIATIYELGIARGTDETSYSPADLVTREQMASFLARLLRLAEADASTAATTTAVDPTETEYPFDDISENSFARADIALLFDRAITTGTSEAGYSPAEAVTREQMAAFLGRLYRELAESDDAPAT